MNLGSLRTPHVATTAAHTVLAVPLGAIATPVVVDSQRASALPADSTRTQALLSALVVFRLLPNGFCNRDLRGYLAPLLGLDPALMTQGRMSDDLRRLRLHGLIERIPGSHRYHVTDHGLRIATFLLTRVHTRLVRPGLTAILDEADIPTPIRRHLNRFYVALTDLVRQPDPRDLGRGGVT